MLKTSIFLSTLLLVGCQMTTDIPAPGDDGPAIRREDVSLEIVSAKKLSPREITLMISVANFSERDICFSYEKSNQPLVSFTRISDGWELAETLSEGVWVNSKGELTGPPRGYTATKITLVPGGKTELPLLRVITETEEFWEDKMKGFSPREPYENQPVTASLYGNIFDCAYPDIDAARSAGWQNEASVSSSEFKVSQ
ncbi:MAG: hypothetical protein EP336_07830 [Rhodobacteraceae bacterium]|nr:MAG: hypothetical protein EP336_07830 [Paracoccaceae bacterium]